jgi:hypothetical protein
MARISEGREIAGSDMRCRIEDLERGGTSACPGVLQPEAIDRLKVKTAYR